VQRKRSKALAPTLDIIRKNAVHTSLKAVDASRVCPHDTPPSLSHLEASRAVLGLAAAARGLHSLARRQETGKLRRIQEIEMADGSLKLRALIWVLRRQRAVDYRSTDN
jgi:hypothetical protein